jgi:hypothetical protein
MAQDDESDAGPPIASGRPNWPFRGTPVERPGCICRLGSPRPRADRSEADDLWKHPWIDPMKTLVGGRTVRILTIIVIAIGVVGILISLPVLGLAALGYLGALADVGPAQNRIMGSSIALLGTPTLDRRCGVVRARSPSACMESPASGRRTPQRNRSGGAGCGSRVIGHAVLASASLVFRTPRSGGAPPAVWIVVAGRLAAHLPWSSVSGSGGPWAWSFDGKCIRPSHAMSLRFPNDC